MDIRPKSPVIADEAQFENKLCNLAGQITLKTGQSLQVSCIATFHNKQEFKGHIEASCITPGDASIATFDDRLKNLFNRIIDDVYPNMSTKPIFLQLKTLMNIDDDLLKKITGCSSAALIKDFAAECDNEDRRIVDGIITAPRV